MNQEFLTPEELADWERLTDRISQIITARIALGKKVAVEVFGGVTGLARAYDFVQPGSMRMEGCLITVRGVERGHHGHVERHEVYLSRLDLATPPVEWAEGLRRSWGDWELRRLESLAREREATKQQRRRHYEELRREFAENEADVPSTNEDGEALDG